MSTPTTPKEALKWIVDGAQGVSKAVTDIFHQFKSAMNELMPKLNKHEQEQVHHAFGQYNSFLMKTQEFVSYTLTGVKYAQTIVHLIEAVPVKILMELIGEVQDLLKKFEMLQSMVRTKVQDESSLRSFKHIMLCIGAIGLAVALMASGVGIAAGFGVAVKTVAILGGTTAVVGVAGAAIAHASEKITDFSKVMESLKEMQKCLVAIEQQQAIVKGKHGWLTAAGVRDLEQEKMIVSDMKVEFTDALNKTQVEVDKGFNIIKF